MKTNAGTRNLESIYALLVNEEDARVCTDIPDEACRYTPRNFFLILAANTLTKLGDALANPKTVLAWLMAYVQAPLFLVGFLVPIRESGSMLPQILIASFVRQVARRKWVWVAGALLQACAVAGIAFAALTLAGARAGWSILALLAFSALPGGSVQWPRRTCSARRFPGRGAAGWADSAARFPECLSCWWGCG